MKKKVGLGLVLLLAGALLIPSGRAHAQVEPAGLGLGADVALASDQMGTSGGPGVASLGVTGLSLNYWINPNITLNFILNAGFISPNGGDLITRLGFGAGVFGVIARGEHTLLELGGRVSVGAVLASNNQSVGVLGLEIPLRVEHFFDRNFSVNGQVGLSVGVAPREGEAVPFTLAIGSVTGWGGIGFMYYFDGANGMGGSSAASSSSGGYQAPQQQQQGGYQAQQQQQGGGDPEAGGGW